MFETRISKRQGIRWPTVSGAISQRPNPETAAGGNGGRVAIMISTLADRTSGLRKQICELKSLTDELFGANADLLSAATEVKTVDHIAVEEEGSAKEATSCSLEPYVQVINQGKSQYIQECARPRATIKAQSSGMEEVASIECAYGRHHGLDDLTTLLILPLDAGPVSNLVAAGGGIVDVPGSIAALAPGADGAVMGARFTATVKRPIRTSVKE